MIEIFSATLSGSRKNDSVMLRLHQLVFFSDFVRTVFQIVRRNIPTSSHGADLSRIGKPRT